MYGGDIQALMDGAIWLAKVCGAGVFLVVVGIVIGVLVGRRKKGDEG